MTQQAMANMAAQIKEMSASGANIKKEHDKENQPPNAQANPYTNPYCKHCKGPTYHAIEDCWSQLTPEERKKKLEEVRKKRMQK